ncbi:MAG: tetratricopeptide repeat protein [Prevotella sp.]|jgi:tetratricopeptide (TPR) repeat protein|nr:tetratricopeptide repeat protein [Prevotella sp.]
MQKKKLFSLYALLSISIASFGQINTDRVMIIGRNALYYEDYVLSIQYFNQVIKTKPYLAEPYYYRAIAKYFLGDAKGAEEDCTSALQHNPFFIDAYQLRGDARLNQENYDGAIGDYKKTLEYSPDNKFALINTGVANIHKKDYDNAEKGLNELVSAYPNYTEGILVRGSMYAEKGDTIKAFADYDKAIEIDKYFYPSYSMRGLLYYGRKNYDKALSDLNEAIRLNPDAVGNYINRGLIKYGKKDFRGAMEDYDNVVAKEPNNLIARFNRGLLRSQVGDDNRAIEDFDLVIKLEPNNYIAYLNRALMKQNIGDYKGALNDLNIVLEEYPDFYQGFYMRSDIKRRQNDVKGAEKDYNYALKEEEKLKRQTLSEKPADTAQKDKDLSKSKNEEGGTREKSDNAIEKFNLLVVADADEQQKSKYQNEARGRVQDRQVKIELTPKYVLSYYKKASELKDFVHFNAALENINRKKVLNRRLLFTNNEIALTGDRITLHFASIDEYSKLIAEHPNNADYYFARALDYMLVQNYSSAIEDLHEAIRINSGFVLAYFSLAVAYTKQLELKENASEYEISATSLKRDKSKTAGDALKMSAALSAEQEADKKRYEYELIIANYNKALELDPDFVYAYYNRAEIRSMQRDFRSAILDYNEAIRKDPNFPDAYFNRGLNRLQLGEKDKGLADLRKAGELGVPNAYNIIKRMGE